MVGNKLRESAGRGGRSCRAFIELGSKYLTFALNEGKSPPSLEQGRDMV